MTNNRNIKMDQKGFTLVEIIAVLVILGILAAVAVPKFFDMQESSEYKSLDVAFNDMKSRAVSAFSKSMMANNGVAVVGECDGWDDFGLNTAALINAAYLDFSGTWSTDGTTISYAMNNGNPTATITFTITAPPADGTGPATIVKSALP